MDLAADREAAALAAVMEWDTEDLAALITADTDPLREDTDRPCTTAAGGIALIAAVAAVSAAVFP